MKGVSLFSSAGIGEFYLKDIGIDIVLANEIDKKRCDLFSYFYPSAEMINGDIQNTHIKKEIIKKSKECKFLIATPPCQGFSTLGVTKKTESLNTDLRNFLIFDVLDIIDKNDFDYILIENVPRFLQLYYPFRGSFKNIEEILNIKYSKKYQVHCEVLDAKYFGIPQSRKRSIIRIYKKHLNWNNCSKEDIITLKKSIGHLPSLESGEFSNIKWHYAKKHNIRDIEAMRHTPEGKSALLNDIYYPKKDNGSRISGFHNTYKRMKWDEPAKARTTNCGNIGSHNNVHPGRKLKNGTFSDARVLTLLETFIVSSLPEDMDLPNWVSDSFIRKMIGESIPPLMCKKIISKVF
jgi:DNA (cytosine-5)-methyltransferase 1